MPTLPPAAVAPLPTLHWTEDDEPRQAGWRSERGLPPPRTVRVVDDRLSADLAYGLACQGTGLLWRGDFHNARQLLSALATRCDRQRRAPAPLALDAAPTERAACFHRERQARAQRARTLGMLLVPLNADYTLPLRRAPDVRTACHETYGISAQASWVALREVLGLTGAYEWQRTGLAIPTLSAPIHPAYGVFAPTRREYLELVNRAPLPAATREHGTAWDIGTGTGVLAALLAQRGVRRIVATDLNPRALACARANFEHLGMQATVTVQATDLFPEGRAGLIVCNPPWVPARPTSALEHGVYDPDSQMLRGFLTGLAAHLETAGEGWLILSDLAEHLGLRTRTELLAWIADAGLRVIDRLDTRAQHPRANDRTDPLHAARAAEVTSLWRLAPGP